MLYTKEEATPEGDIPDLLIEPCSACHDLGLVRILQSYPNLTTNSRLPEIMAEWCRKFSVSVKESAGSGAYKARPHPPPQREAGAENQTGAAEYNSVVAVPL